MAWILYTNFFAFHGIGRERVFIHLHDVAHYYLGAKYFPELGYQRLYTAMLRAEAEKYENHFRSLEARDLETNGLVDIRALLARSDPVKARFSAERWAAFQEDVAFFRGWMKKQWGEVLRDHGFNPPPLWPLLGGALANLVPAGSHAGILALTLARPGSPARDVRIHRLGVRRRSRCCWRRSTSARSRARPSAGRGEAFSASSGSPVWWAPSAA